VVSYVSVTVVMCHSSSRNIWRDNNSTTIIRQTDCFHAGAFPVMGSDVEAVLGKEVHHIYFDLMEGMVCFDAGDDYVFWAGVWW
jgi:hypothetical protein